MPKFFFAYQGLFRRLNPFRSKANFQAARPVPLAINPVENKLNFNLLSTGLPSRFSDSVAGRHPSLHQPAIPQGRPSPTNLPGHAGPARPSIEAYLLEQGNLPDDIAKLKKLMAMRHVLLEIGCGTCEAAWEIAAKNHDWGVIATDSYAWGVASTESSHYQKLAQDWKAKQLTIQQTVPANLVVLRAEAKILHFLPDLSIDAVLLVNPEPLVGLAFLDLLSANALHAKIKPSNRQIVILPFSREMGMVACGGCEFDHAQDWSRGLGFLMSSGFKFRKADKVQWGVDLSGSSLYSKNSTQTDVYLYGNPL
jgi:hypothetical protein